MLSRLKYIFSVAKQAAFDFNGDACFRASAALSFYTLFSIAPVALITISTASLFVDGTVIRDEVTESFRSLIGERGAEGVFVLMDVIRTDDSGVVSLVSGIAILVFSATTIFVQIKKGFNDIYKVRPAEGTKGWIKLIRDRLISMGIVFSLGFMMLVSLMLDTLIMSLVRFLSRRYEEVSLVLLQILQNIVILGLAYLVIFALFRWLPDAVVPRRFLVRGAALTTFLLLLGKFIIGWYISTSDLNELGGAAASIVVLMLWVYYSSAILYFGAELIKAQTIHNHVAYHAGPYAKKVKVVEIDEAKEHEPEPAGRKRHRSLFEHWR